MKRPLRLGHVLVTVEDLLIVTWPLAEQDLRRRLPHPLLPFVWRGGALVSAVLFQNRSLRPALLGVPRINSYQINVRSYVVAGESGEPGSVFFHGLFLSRRWLAGVSSWLFNVPFRYLPMTLSSRAGETGIVEWIADGRDGRMMLRAEESDMSLDAETLDLLTNPHTAYFVDRRRMLRRWSIWRRPQRVRTMAITRATMPSWMAPCGAGAPISALFVESVDYEVYLPPSKVLEQHVVPRWKYG